MSKKILLAATLITMLIVNISYANRNSMFDTVITDIKLGSGLSINGQSQAFYLKDGIETAYLADRKKTALFNAELFIGYQSPFIERQYANFFFQLGISLVTGSNINMEGDALDLANDNFDNFKYSYQVTHGHAAVKAKLFVSNEKKDIQFFTDLSLGFGANRSSSFILTQKDLAQVPPPLFTASTIISSVIYTAGFGIQKVMPDNWAFGIGYEYSNWGKSELGKAAGQTLNTGIKVDGLYLHSVYISCSFID